MSEGLFSDVFTQIPIGHAASICSRTCNLFHWSNYGI